MGPDSIREVFRGHVIRVEIETWPAGDREIVRHLGAAAVVAITPDDHVLLVRQFREPVRRALLEIPAGLLDEAGEDAPTCASRELFEETGYRAEAVEFLGGFFPSPGFTDEYFHLFMARASAEAEGEPEEGIEVVRMPFEEACRVAKAGRLRDVKTALALLLAEARRSRE